MAIYSYLGESVIFAFREWEDLGDQLGLLTVPTALGETAVAIGAAVDWMDPNLDINSVPIPGALPPIVEIPEAPTPPPPAPTPTPAPAPCPTPA